MWETECTGDYGLSDCQFVTEDIMDYVDSWFTPANGNKQQDNEI